jgi:hypothetical protein
VKLDQWEVFIETLIKRIIYASKSVLDLSKGTKITSVRSKVSMEIVDYPSIYVLVRSIIEGFLTLEYLYFNEIEKDERKFRFRLWEVSGLRSRQAYKPHFHQDLIEKQKIEKERIEELMKVIRSSPYYSKLKQQQIWKLDNYGLPRMDGWQKLIQQSCLNQGFYEMIYSLFSNYAHSEFLSMIQLKESNQWVSDKDNSEKVELAQSFVRMINAVIISKLKESYKSAEIVYNSLPTSLLKSIEMWYRVALGGKKL